MTDLSKISFATSKLNIVHPQSLQETGLVLHLVHVDDPSVKAARRGIQDRLLKLQSKGKSPTSEQIETNRFDLLFAMITGWEWGKVEDGDDRISWNGEQLAFTRSNVFMMLREFPTFADQIDAYCGDIENFIQA